MIIGLSGYARSGKDSVAEVLVEEYGFIRLAFADKLRQALYALNPYIGHTGNGGRVFLQTVVDGYGWDGVKDTRWGPEVRRLLQRMGTEAGRNVLGENVWVNAAALDVGESGNYVFTDCRFINEARVIVGKRGEVWRITRPGVEPANDHISEIGLDNYGFNRIILNDQDLDTLRLKVKEAYEETACRL